jgi:hypothetical protein
MLPASVSIKTHLSYPILTSDKAVADVRARRELGPRTKAVTALTDIVPEDAKVKADEDPSVHINLNISSREASLPIPNTAQPQVIQVDVVQSSKLLPHHDVTTLSLPDPLVPVPGDATLDPIVPVPGDAIPAPETYTLPTTTANFDFSVMHVDTPVRSTSMQPEFGHAPSDGTITVVDPSPRFSMPPSMPAPSMASDWSYNFVNNSLGYNDSDMADAYPNPMSQYTVPIYRTYSHCRILIVKLTSL